MTELVRIVETFELRHTRDLRYFFTFRAANGQAIVDSQLHETRSSALAAIETLRRGAHVASLRDLCNATTSDV